MKLKIAGSFVLVATLIAALGYGSGGSTCAFPSCFPSATNTGVPSGTSLTTYSGGDVTVDNTVITGKNITCLTVKASNVIVRNSHISCGDFIAVQCEPSSGCGTTGSLLIEDSEIDCTGFGSSGFVGQGTGIEAENFTIRRVDIHACENGASVGENVLIEDSYIHDLYNDNVVPPPDGAHADGVQFDGAHDESGTTVRGAKNITIRHTAIEGGGYPNSATSTSDPFTLGTSSIITNRGPTDIDNNILIEKNLMSGGGTQVYCEQDGYAATNERVINNHFSTDHGAYNSGSFPFISTDCSNESNISGNVIHETGVPVTLD
jgi:hypothetical protein